MAFKFSCHVDPEGMTVPYLPRTDEIRRNRGFVDLRGRPDKANEIAEGGDSLALRNLLVRVAKAGSPIFTIGCDLGAHQEPTNVPARRREVAGGYIQSASIHYDRAEPESYSACANAIGKNVKARRDTIIGSWTASVSGSISSLTVTRRAFAPPCGFGFMLRRADSLMPCNRASD
jgi:hypothetical protein